MTQFSDTFPGNKRNSLLGYGFYLPGDLFQCQSIPFSMKIFQEMERASLALGEFSTLIKRIPNPELFLHCYLSKEATLSSKIEGTKTEIEDAYFDDADIQIERRDDWSELQAYIKAFNEAVQNLEVLPLCTRLIRQAHQTLLSQVRGKDKLPGEFRRSQNWIGGSRPDNAHFVPPSYEYVSDLMSNLEKFIQDQKAPIPHLIKVALIHYQFETIHPFLDGNGRIGRMLISLYLVENKILEHPILYISSFFEKHRNNYYLSLDKARESQEGVIKWVSFFLDGVYQTARNGIEVTEKLIAYREDLVENKIPTLGRRAPKAFTLLDYLFSRLVVNAKMLQESLNLSPQVAQKMLRDFIDLGILEEITGHKRNRVFVMRHYFDTIKVD